MLMCTLPWIYYKDRNILEYTVNLRSIPLTINPEPRLGIHFAFYRGKTITDGSLAEAESKARQLSVNCVSKQ